MPPDNQSQLCIMHADLQRELSSIRQDQGEISAGIAGILEVVKALKENYGDHVRESNEHKYRERIALLEEYDSEHREVEKGLKDEINKNAEYSARAIATIKKGYWKACLVAGLIGGLLGHIAPDFFDLLTTLLKIHLGG